VRGVPTSVTYPGFSICVEKDDGQRYRRDFAFITNVVRFAGQSSCESPMAPAGEPSGGGAASAEPATGEKAAEPSFFSRLKARIGARMGKWFGH
jgi:hypothetical protein